MVYLANLLAERGHDVELVTYYSNVQLRELLDERQVELVQLRKFSRFDWTLLYRLTRHYRSSSPDCVISYLTTPNFYARVCASLAGVPKIITSERNVDLFSSSSKLFLERMLGGLSDTIVANSYTAADLYRTNLKSLSARVRVITNALDLDTYHRNGSPTFVVPLRSALGIDPEAFVVTLPGTIRPQKNHLALVRAFVSLPSAFRERSALLFVGNIEYAAIQQEMVRLAEVHRVAHRLHFAGVQSDMVGVYNLSDLVVLPSLYEGFPNVVLEAMACERIVAASDVSDNARIIDHGVNGLLFPPSDVDALRQAIETVISFSAEQRERIATSARRKVHRLCSLEAFVDDYESLLSM